jgi:hypothetical protein
MSTPHGRPKAGETPRGGVARSAGVLNIPTPHGRPKACETPLGGRARSAGVPT